MGARIPTTGGRSVVPQPLRLPLATPASFGAADAAALQDLGAGLGNLAEELARSKERARKASARNNLTNLQSGLTDALHGENGFLNRQPVDGQNIFAEYQSGIAADQQKFIDAIPDQLEREIIQANWDRLNLTASGQVLRGQGANVRAFDKQTLLAHSGTLTDAFIVGDIDAETGTDYRTEIIANTRNMFSADAGESLIGQDLEDFELVVKRAADTAIQNGYVKKVKAINARSSEKALLFAKENFEFLPPATRDQLVEALTEKTMIEQGQKIAEEVLIDSTLSRTEQNEKLNKIKDPKIKAAARAEIDRRRSDIEKVRLKIEEKAQLDNYALTQRTLDPNDINKNFTPAYQEWLQDAIDERIAEKTDSPSNYTLAEKEQSVVVRGTILNALVSPNLEVRQEAMKLTPERLTKLGLTVTDYNAVSKELLDLRRGQFKWTPAISRQQYITQQFAIQSTLVEDAAAQVKYTAAFDRTYNELVRSGTVIQDKVNAQETYDLVNDIITRPVRVSQVGFGSLFGDTTVARFEAEARQRIDPSIGITIRGAATEEGLNLEPLDRGKTEPFAALDSNGKHRVGRVRWLDSEKIKGAFYEVGVEGAININRRVGEFPSEPAPDEFTFTITTEEAEALGIDDTFLQGPSQVPTTDDIIGRTIKGSIGQFNKPLAGGL